LRICIISSSFPANASDARASAGLFVKDFALALRDSGHTVTVVAPDKLPAEKLDPEGINVCWFSWLGGGKQLVYLRPYNPFDVAAMISLLRQGERALIELAEQDGFDHIIAMWAVPSGYLASALKRRLGTPFTTWCLGSDIWYYGRIPVLRGIVRRVIRSSDLLYADGIELGRSVTRLSGCDCQFLASSRRLNRALIRPLKDLPDGFKFLFVGRYAKVKGVDVLLAAMIRFLEEGHQDSLFMFGGGPLRGFIETTVAKNGLGDHVFVGDYADEATTVSYLDACDCLVISSRMESIPVVLSDALQMGKPVIVTDVGDMGTLLREHPAGLVVPPDDSVALARAMADMSSRPHEDLAPHIAALARKFDISRVAETWVNAVAG